METAHIAYLTAIKHHLNECEQDLNDLKVIVEARNWTRIEQSAAERRLQVLIESCIGVAKHWVKKELSYSPPEPRKALTMLVDKGLIDDSIPWHKVIGLRNALVHDYLEVDPAVVRSVIEQNYHQALLAFGRNALKALQSENI